MASLSSSRFFAATESGDNEIATKDDVIKQIQKPVEKFLHSAGKMNSIRESEDTRRAVSILKKLDDRITEALKPKPEPEASPAIIKPSF